jgi:hypothetical protein
MHAFAALCLSLLGLPHPVRAELAPMKPGRVFLASSTEEVVASGAKDLFRERIILDGRPGCVAVTFSGEISGIDGDLDPGDDVLVSFEVMVDEELATAPIFYGVPATELSRLVSLTGQACNVPPGPHDVSVRVRTEVAGDQVAVGARTLEVWLERGRAVPNPIGTAPAD